MDRTLIPRVDRSAVQTYRGVSHRRAVRRREPEHPPPPVSDPHVAGERVDADTAEAAGRGKRRVHLPQEGPVASERGDDRRIGSRVLSDDVDVALRPGARVVNGDVVAEVVEPERSARGRWTCQLTEILAVS